MKAEEARRLPYNTPIWGFVGQIKHTLKDSKYESLEDVVFNGISIPVIRSRGIGGDPTLVAEHPVLGRKKVQAHDAFFTIQDALQRGVEYNEYQLEQAERELNGAKRELERFRRNHSSSEV